MSQRQKQQALPLFIRYPDEHWIVFDDTNESIQHQKKGLELFIESGQDILDVSIPDSNGGQFMAGYSKIVNKNNETGEDIILYYYIKATLEIKLETVQMMYAKPEYIAYINRLTT
jgi:hypothetical protein